MNRISTTESQSHRALRLRINYWPRFRNRGWRLTWVAVTRMPVNRGFWIMSRALRAPLGADSDEAGHAFQLESGHPFRDDAGHHPDLKAARRQCPVRVGGMMFWFSVGVKP